jgi:hypothetical protein
MCVSIDNNKTCAFSGLPLSKQTNLGVFCDELCGYKEAQIFDLLSQESTPQRIDVLPTKPLEFGKQKSLSATADKYIDAVHSWIETMKSKFFS